MTAGRLITRRNRLIGVQVSLEYLPNEDESCRWQTDCEHGECVGHATRKVAVEFLSVPWEWCAECRELHEAKTKQRASIKNQGQGRTEDMEKLNCELPAVPRFNVSQDASGTASVVPDPKGRYQLKEAQEIADLQNGVYRVYAGKVFLGHVKYAKPKTGGPSVAYTAAAPEVGKEFSSLEQAIGWLREGKPQS